MTESARGPLGDELAQLVDEYRRDVNFPRALARTAPVSFALLMAIGLVHVAAIVFGASVGEAIAPSSSGFELSLMYGAKINALVLDSGQYWRLSSALFLHGGLVHLAFNAYALFLIGPLLERLYGSRRFALIYMVSGIASEFASVVFTDGPSVGASGALFGLLGALIIFGLRFRPRLPPRIARAFGGRLIVLVALNIGIGFIPFLPFDNAAHLGGLVAGMLVALPLSNAFSKEPTGIKALGLELGLALSCLTIAYGFVFMFRQVVTCATSAAEFFQCHPPDLIGL